MRFDFDVLEIDFRVAISATRCLWLHVNGKHEERSALLCKYCLRTCHRLVRAVRTTGIFEVYSRVTCTRSHIHGLVMLL